MLESYTLQSQDWGSYKFWCILSSLRAASTHSIVNVTKKTTSVCDTPYLLCLTWNHRSKVKVTWWSTVDHGYLKVFDPKYMLTKCEHCTMYMSKVAGKAKFYIQYIDTWTDLKLYTTYTSCKIEWNISHSSCQDWMYETMKCCFFPIHI